eukprot:CAMPEP_0168763812 /NCGR_PEP_ID=MMETSP0724-20121128/24557_1 /TAXON_ID=265536 /ORGANISM="Amphiprora sp., Strain CCMP467" /LENGTH=514 /DNA_ID=CAMNT_0008813029 /DNA_START=25 /DNA_END=1566 /DNA_ORIENTATION=+
MGPCLSAPSRRKVSARNAQPFRQSTTTEDPSSDAISDDALDATSEILFDSCRITKSIYRQQMSRFQKRRWNKNAEQKAVPCRRLTVRDSIFAEEGDRLSIPANERRFLEFLSSYPLGALEEAEFSCSLESSSTANGPLYTSAVCLMLPNLGCNPSLVNLRELAFSTTVWSEERDFIGLCLCKILKFNPKLEVVNLTLRTTSDEDDEEQEHQEDTALRERMDRLAHGLKSLRHLRQFSLIGSNIEDSHLNKIATALGIDAKQISADAATTSKNHPQCTVREPLNLQKLDLSSNTRLTTRSLPLLSLAIQSYGALHSLNLAGCSSLLADVNFEMEWDAFVRAATGSRLQSLSLKNCCLNDDAVETLFEQLATTSASPLRHLDVSSNLDLTISALQTLVRHLPKMTLTRLNMYNTSMYNSNTAAGVDDGDDGDDDAVADTDQNFAIRLALYQALAKNMCLLSLDLGHVRRNDDTGEMESVYCAQDGDAEIVSKILERNELIRKTQSMLECHSRQHVW